MWIDVILIDAWMDRRRQAASDAQHTEEERGLRQPQHQLPGITRACNTSADPWVSGRLSDSDLTLWFYSLSIYSRHKTIVLHGLGAAVNRTINLALQLQQRFSDTLIVSLRLHLFEIQV
jgi:hypothetical protein